MDWATLVIAAIGLALSVALAAVKVWETFLARSRFDVMFDWFDASDIDVELNFTIANVGHRPDSVRVIMVISEDESTYRPDTIQQKLPVLLAPGAVSPRFTLSARTDVAHDPGNSLFVGTARLRLINSRGAVREFPVPGAYDGDGMYGWEDEPPRPSE